MYFVMCTHFAITLMCFLMYLEFRDTGKNFLQDKVSISDKESISGKGSISDKESISYIISPKNRACA